MEKSSTSPKSAQVPVGRRVSAEELRTFFRIVFPRNKFRIQVRDAGISGTIASVSWYDGISLEEVEDAVEQLDPATLLFGTGHLLTNAPGKVLPGAMFLFPHPEIATRISPLGEVLGWSITGRERI